jgi:hypothetical protein
MRRPSPFRRAARIEDLEAVALFVERHVGVAEDDRTGVGKPRPKPLQATLGGAGVVDHAEDDPIDLERQGLRQVAPELGAVDVAVDGGDGSKLAEVGKSRGVTEVAGVDDQVRGLEGVETAVRKPALTAWQMGVGDQREPDDSVPVALRARPLGQHLLEIGGLFGAPPVLVLLVRGHRGIDGLVLLSGPVVLGLAQLLR